MESTKMSLSPSRSERPDGRWFTRVRSWVGGSPADTVRKSWKGRRSSGMTVKKESFEINSSRLWGEKNKERDEQRRRSGS